MASKRSRRSVSHGSSVLSKPEEADGLGPRSEPLSNKSKDGLGPRSSQSQPAIDDSSVDHSRVNRSLCGPEDLDPGDSASQAIRDLNLSDPQDSVLSANTAAERSALLKVQLKAAAARATATS